MNCRPNDMAIIVKASDKHEEAWIGTVVRVTRLSGKGLNGANWCWAYEGKQLVHPLWGTCLGIADSCLRPIRGDGVTDDEVRELYAPKLPETAADHRPVHAGYPEAA